MSHKISQPMSMEAVLDEERRAILALLEGPAKKTSPSAAAVGRSASPLSNNPRSPVRSLLDVSGDEPVPWSSGTIPASASASASTAAAGKGKGKGPAYTAPRVRSMLDVDSPPRVVPPIRSMLDVDSPPPPAALTTTGPGTVFSAQNSPSEPNYRIDPPGSQQQQHHTATASSQHRRSWSDAVGKPVDPFARSNRVDPTADYQFSDIITSRESPMLQRRSLAGSSTSAAAKRATNSMVGAIRSGDIRNQTLSLHGRPLAGSTRRGSAPKSKSPSNRSMSPHPGLAARNMSPAGQAFLAENQHFDMQNAYRRLSDANLARSGGSLSELPLRKRSDDQGAHGIRLTKDYISQDGDELMDESSEDEASSSDDNDEANRGRKTARTFPDDVKGKGVAVPGPSGSGSRHQPLSLLAAAEAERIEVAARQPKHQYRSLLDEPEITVTSPTGERVKPGKQGKPMVHPNSSFDVPSRSQSRTPWYSDDEAEYSDIKRAQNLTVSMTPIITSPETQRSIRIIYRGDFNRVQREIPDSEHRRPRKYLAATDMSEESTHALEWTVGTVLRDGDTLIAIYCVDEEKSIPLPEGADEPEKTREQAAAVLATTNTGKLPGISASPLLSPTSPSPSPSAPLPPSSSPQQVTHSSEPSLSPDAGPSSQPAPHELTKAEEERHRAVQDITNRITRLLRKTSLQVRVIVEVIQCKSPKHLITEVIDLVNPTLVTLGSRGRSALKGVILGSFSNYLVMKSSVPVMVARKRLRKQSKYKRTAASLINNLSNPATRSLANAKID